MSVPLPHLGGLPEICGVVQADRDGQLQAASPDRPGAPQDDAAAAAAALRALGSAGEAVGLGSLLTVNTRGAASAAVMAVRPDALLVVRVDPARPAATVEREARRWVLGEAAPAAAPTGRPAAPAAAPEGSPRRAPRGDPWAALRRALVRSHLHEATALSEALCAAAASAPGADASAGEACEHALRILCEGVGSVMAGDGVGGGRILRPLTGDDQRNVTVRWLALHWSARAALRSGAVPAARAHVQASLALARELDVEARALSQWTAAEVLAHDRDPTRALAWLAEARERFARAADAWGVGQTWLTEARLHLAAGRSPQAAEAAREAAAALPAAEEPQVALARVALLEDDVDGAEARLRPLRTHAAERLRGVIAALRAGALPRGVAAEYVREQEGTPSLRGLTALARIAGAAPRFLPARETLAWMLLRVGRYDEAAAHFRWLLEQPLAPGDRASVTLGLGCVANAQRPAATPAPAAAPAGPAVVRLSGGAGAVFSGQLGSFALPDLLEFLRSGRRTGLLVCGSGAGLGRLRFSEGRITAGAAPGTPGLGQLLVTAGALDPAALRACGVADGADPLGEALAARVAASGVADAAAISAALEERIALAVRELIGWTDGEFAFTREPPGAASPVSVDPQAVLLDVLRQLDEQSRTAAADAST